MVAWRNDSNVINVQDSREVSDRSNLVNPENIPNREKPKKLRRRSPLGMASDAAEGADIKSTRRQL